MTGSKVLIARLRAQARRDEEAVGDDREAGIRGKCVLWLDQVNSSRLHAHARADAGDEEPDAACEAGHFWSGVGRLK